MEIVRRKFTVGKSNTWIHGDFSKDREVKRLLYFTFGVPEGEETIIHSVNHNIRTGEYTFDVTVHNYTVDDFSDMASPCKLIMPVKDVLPHDNDDVWEHLPEDKQKAIQHGFMYIDDLNYPDDLGMIEIEIIFRATNKLATIQQQNEDDTPTLEQH